MTLVDLTQTLRDGMFSQRLFPPVRVERCVRIEDRGLNVTKLDVCVHHGTHLDAPRHFIADGPSVETLPLDAVSGPAVGLSVSRGPGEAVTADDLEAAGRDVRAGDIVLLHTGWGEWFATDPERYQVHPYLSEDAAQWLVERHIKLLAVDLPTPDMPEPVRPAGFDWPVHHLLLGSGVLIAEHLAHLDRIAGQRVRAFAFPLPIAGADGSPVRFVAEVES